MCLTEPQAGTDLEPDPHHGPRHRATAPIAVTGTKMFISAGEHDLAANIIYLVSGQASRRTEGHQGHLTVRGAEIPGGRKPPLGRTQCGLVQRHRTQDGDQGLGHLCDEFRRRRRLAGGRAASGPQGDVRHDECRTLAVGISGLAVAEASYQTAVAYARERRQGRTAATPPTTPDAADPILVHADVRRMLLTQRALIEGCRMLALWVAEALDVSERHARYRRMRPGR